MRQPRWIGWLGVAALMAAAGCEDPPVFTAMASPAPSTSPVPSLSPGASTSPSPVPSGSRPPLLGASPSPLSTFTPRPPVTPIPGVIQPPASPTPRPVGASPSPAPSASPTAGAVSIVLDAPTTSTDFSKTAIDILGHVTVATGTTLKSVQVIYDGAAIASQAAAGNTITFKAWNPSIANSLGTPQDTTPVPFGPHTLLLRAVTSTGATVDSSELDFDKPLIFRGWKNTTSVNGSDVTIPNLTSPRTGMPLYATHGFLFGFFGDGENGLPAPGVISLSLLGLATPTWSPHAAPGLTWRHHVALAGSDATVYLVGGQPSAGQQQPGAAPGLAAPTVRADAFDLFNHTALQLPDLPQAVTDAGAAIVNHYLYVVAGTTTGAATDATRRVFRLALAADDTPSATAQWEERSPLPVPLRGAAAAVGGGRLFVMGGQAPDGSRRESVYAYDAAGDAWQRVQIMPMAVSDGTAADFGGSIYYFGGYGADGAPSQNTFRFDYGNTALGMPVRAFGAGAPNLPSARALAGVAVLTDQEHGQRLFVAGGETTGPNGIGPIPDVAMGDTL